MDYDCYEDEMMINMMKVGHMADRNAKMFCGGVAVFPRSHWIVQDRIANSTSDQSFLQPCDLPAAAPMEVLLLGFLPILFLISLLNFEWTFCGTKIYLIKQS